MVFNGYEFKVGIIGKKINDIIFFFKLRLYYY